VSPNKAKLKISDEQSQYDDDEPIRDEQYDDEPCYEAKGVTQGSSTEPCLLARREQVSTDGQSRWLWYSLPDLTRVI